MKKRYSIGEKIANTLDDLVDDFETFDKLETISQRRLEKTQNKFLVLIEESTPKWEYAATAASSLFSNPDYDKVKEHIIEYNLWTSEMEALEAVAQTCRMDRS